MPLSTLKPKRKRKGSTMSEAEKKSTAAALAATEPNFMDRWSEAAMKTPMRQMATGALVVAGGVQLSQRVISPIVEKVSEAITNRGKEKVAEATKNAIGKSLLKGLGSAFKL